MPLRGTGNLGPSLRGVEGQPFLSRAEGDGSTALWASLRAGGGERGGGAESEEEGSLVLVAGVVLAGGGEPANASLLRVAAAAGDAQRLALPLPKLGDSFPSNKPDGEGLCLPSSGFRTLPPPHPPLCLLPSRGGREETDDGSSGRRWVAGSGRWDAGLRLPGSRCSAPSCACAAAVRYANCSESGPCYAEPRRARRGTVRELARLAPPAGVRGYKRRRAAVTLGLRRVRPVPGWALPGASCPCFFGGPAVPMLLFPILKSRSCRPTRGGNDFPSPGL